MRLGVIADDFTGASDIANTLAKGIAKERGGRGGLSCVQFLGLPRGPAPAGCEAGIVALKSRSIPAAEAVAQSLAALDWLQAQGCTQVVFKYCSTFDSTPQGNIGPVAEALSRRLGVKGVVVCPAFPGAGRTLYQGHLFVGDRALNESGLENHPLNPMTDADIRRWLARQGTGPVGLVPWATVRAGGEAVRAGLEAAAGRGETLVVVDAITDDDLLAIGRACAGAPLLTGGSGIALGLPETILSQLPTEGGAEGGASAFRPAPGPGAVLAGSCSRATLAQVAHHRERHPTLVISGADAMEERVTARAILDFVAGHREALPLVASSAPPETVRAEQAAYGREAVAQKLDALFADAARGLVEAGVTRLVVAGGETSGAVVSALGLDALAIGPEIDPGVPALSATGRPLALALKSGNFGGPDFFARAAAALGGTQ